MKLNLNQIEDIIREENIAHTHIVRVKDKKIKVKKMKLKTDK